MNDSPTSTRIRQRASYRLFAKFADVLEFTSPELSRLLWKVLDEERFFGTERKARFARESVEQLIADRCGESGTAQARVSCPKGESRLTCGSCGTEGASRYQMVRAVGKEWYCWSCSLAYGRRNWVNRTGEEAVSLRLCGVRQGGH